MKKDIFTRRHFVRNSSVLLQDLIVDSIYFQASTKEKVLKVGLIGIGGRGSGAAVAMSADENVALTAIEIYLKIG